MADKPVYTIVGTFWRGNKSIVSGYLNAKAIQALARDWGKGLDGARVVMLENPNRRQANSPEYILVSFIDSEKQNAPQERAPAPGNPLPAPAQSQGQGGGNQGSYGPFEAMPDDVPF